MTGIAVDVAGDVEAALHRSAAYSAAPLPDLERCAALRAAADGLERRAGDLAALMAVEVGKPIALGRGEAERAAEVARYSAAEWETLRGEVVPTAAAAGGAGHIVFTRRTPVGIVCAITPFNFPVGLTLHKLAPALAAGNACVVKPSEHAPQTVAALAEIFTAAGFPEGAVEVVQGGPEVVDALLSSPLPALYSFTGSARVGAKIKAASGLRPVVLELGSNASTIVHDDADVPRAAAAIARGAYAFAGQACFSVQRILVHERIADQFVGQLLNEIEALTVGDPLDPGTVVGPLVDEHAAVRVESMIDNAVAAGARLLCGGTRHGAFLDPTLVDGVDRGQQLWQEEAFGPVALIERYALIDDAFALANDSPYGLQSGIFTRDLDVAVKASEALAAGAVLVNEPSSWRCTPMPFGGIGESGFGREGPRHAIESMTHLKTTVLTL